jgi:hypothetical protein
MKKLSKAKKKGSKLCN